MNTLQFNHLIVINTLFVFLFNTWQGAAQTTPDKAQEASHILDTLKFQNKTYLVLKQGSIAIDTFFISDVYHHLVDWFMESRDTFAYIYGDVHNINYNRFYYNKEKKEYTGLEGFTLDYNRTERPWYRSYMKFSTAKFKDKNTLLVWDEFKQQQQEINLPELKRRREELFKELIEDEKFLNDFQNDK